jgi:hypothetical protein
MDGFGAMLEKAIAGALLVAFVVGGLATLGLYFLVSWLWAHLSVSWT